jgi:hypothetical protein
MTEVKAPTLFDVDCKAYGTYVNYVAYCKKWHASDVLRIAEAKENLCRFKRGMIAHHGERAKKWLAAQI